MALLVAVSLLRGSPTPAAPLVPGTGVLQDKVGDDFEDEDWAYQPNHPKSSREMDKREHPPWGVSANGRWVEGPHRGTPDVLRRVETPPEGLPGSAGALLIRTLRPGVAGKLSFKPQQDDVLVNTTQRIGGFLPVSRSPSVVVRVFVPPFEYWERRNGTSFGFRADLGGTRKRGKMEAYWPGIFFQFRSHYEGGRPRDSAVMVLRAQQSGHDFHGPEVKQLGWWTLGMSFTPDGQVHFYASPGADDLTAQDHIASQYCYGFRSHRFHSFFFNVVTQDDGQSWSTPWIIDDPALYVLPGPNHFARH